MSRLEKLLLHASTSVATLTGIVFLVMKHLMTSSDPFSVVHHPLQPYVLDLHVLVGPVVVFAIGLITREHILGGYRDGRRPRSRGSGIATVLLAAPMVASGYLLQVSTGALARQVLVVAHVATGTLFAVFLAAHLLAARGRRPAAAGGDEEISRAGAGPALIGPDTEV